MVDTLLPSVTDAEQAAIESAGLAAVFRRVWEAFHAALQKVAAQVEHWRAQAQELAAQNQELRARLDQNSQNSSKPPSQDPPGVQSHKGRRHRTGRKRGAQPGHKGHRRELLPQEEVDAIVDQDPLTCSRCGHDLTQAPRQGMDRWQVAEIPEVRPQVVEHHLWEKACPCCGTLNQASPFGQGPRSAFGPNL